MSVSPMLTRNTLKLLKILTSPDLSDNYVKSAIIYYMGDNYNHPENDKHVFDDFYKKLGIDKMASPAVLRATIKALRYLNYE